jgi:hypothetical protein
MRINDVNLLRQVVNYLNKHQESIRIKKMLYCLCTNRWEKDTDYLNSIDPQYLVEQIVREYNTLDQLKLLLQKLITTVNKPKHYIEVAKIIYLSIGQLYPEFHQEHTRKAPAPKTPEPRSPEPTQAYTSTDVPSSVQRAYAPQPTQAYTSADVPSSVQRAYAPQPTQAYTSADVPSSVQRAYAPEPTNQFDELSPLIDESVDESAYETCYEEAEPEEFAQNGSIQIAEYDPFVLRQNVMSSTNPLRAKIILLVMLRPNSNYGNQSLAAMREYYLDDLLSEVMRTYPTVEDLEENMTCAIEQLVEVEEYGKTATGLLQSLVPLYIQSAR